jgi:hypothetical protein
MLLSIKKKTSPYDLHWLTIAKWFPWQPSFPSVRVFLPPFITFPLSLHIPRLCPINIAAIYLLCLQIITSLFDV